jgi:Rieske Fe-S protein
MVGVLTGGIGVAAAAILGRAAIGPSLNLRPSRWVRAARLDELETNVPTPVTLRIIRQDGYLEIVDQQVVFLVRSDKGTVRGLSSSCAHLGCSVAFSREKQQFLCPCHNGVFNFDGTVAAGPAPRPLDALVVRVDRARVLVQV